MTVREVEILLVEDSPSDAELTLRALKEANVPSEKILVLTDGAAALDFIFGQGAAGDGQVRQQPRILLLDLKLPKVDGLDVLRRVKSDERSRMMPVVMLTSSHEERDVAKCYELGANSYIVKPVQYEDFIRAVSRLGLYWVSINHPASS